MDGKSRWADNIMIERWFRSFKYEEAYLTQYNNIKEARAAIGRYIHTYNFERCHSALDYKTDKILRRELRLRAADATIIIVAQRIGTIKDADRIIVLKEGRIAGMGTHRELMKSCDLYKEIAHSQLSKEELENE
mgnify:CR=1 FL=1